MYLPIYLPILKFPLIIKVLAYATKIKFFPLHFNKFLEENCQNLPHFHSGCTIIMLDISWSLVFDSVGLTLLTLGC